MAGIGEGLMLVAFCGSCTFLTSISLSAIATNGAMKVLYTQRGLAVTVIIISWIFLEDLLRRNRRGKTRVCDGIGDEQIRGLWNLEKR